jgi:DNA-binding TFAR19-related protein (PDSD5 family)
MSESELNAIRRKKLRELQSRLAKKEKKTKEINVDNVLNKIFRGRAWEVFNAASSQYPRAMQRIKEVLVKLALTGTLNEVTGEQLNHFLKNLGLKIRLNTKINFADHGKLKSLAEKMKDDL